MPFLELFLVYFLGLVASVLANTAIYSLAYNARAVGPWLAPSLPTGTRNGLTRLPVVGWWWTRKPLDASEPTPWLRPMLIEALFPLCLVAFYWWETQGRMVPAIPAMPLPANVLSGLRWQAIAHCILLTLLLIATFIDFDERSIPDWVTVPGTLFALMGSALFPSWHLWTLTASGTGWEALHAMSPERYPVSWFGTHGLQLALLNYSLWCFALADRRLILRRGMGKAIEYFLAGLTRHSSWKVLAGIWGLGCGAIWLSHALLPPSHWQSLFNSLAGMMWGCALVWGVRIVASLAMGVEALGFGDVTLMAMVGAFLGWQSVWIAFFLAPILAIAIVLLVWMLTGDHSTPYGPYLAAGTVVVLVDWTHIWDGWFAVRLQVIGISLLLWLILSLLFLLGGMLWALQWAKRMFR